MCEGEGNILEEAVDTDSLANKLSLGMLNTIESSTENRHGRVARGDVQWRCSPKGDYVCSEITPLSSPVNMYEV